MSDINLLSPIALNMHSPTPPGFERRSGHKVTSTYVTAGGVQISLKRAKPSMWRLQRRRMLENSSVDIAKVRVRRSWNSSASPFGRVTAHSIRFSVIGFSGSVQRADPHLERPVG